MLARRTTENGGNGNGSRPTGITGGSGGSDNTDSVGTRVVLPIVLILSLVVLGCLFGLWCRRVLHRSVRPPRLLRPGRTDIPPTMWDTHLCHAEDRDIPLQELQARSL
jgi:hypothetical protein